jgi:pyruvate-formate lyase
MASTAQQATKAKAEESPWRGFRSGLWQKQIDVRDFIQQNYEPYEGDESFLASATDRTEAIWDRLNQLFVEERKKRARHLPDPEARSRRTPPATSTVRTRSSSVCRPTRR